MSKYTTEVRFICEYSAGLTKSTGYQRVNEIIDLAYPVVFDFDFPIYDETYKPVLCKKILKHYYTREIGEETVGLWKLRLDTRLNEIMPYYNQLYRSAMLEFDPFYDTHLTKEGSRQGAEEKKGSSNTTGSKTGNETNDRVTSNIETFNDTKQFDGANEETQTFADTQTKDGTIDNTETFADTHTKNGTKNNTETFNDTQTENESNENTKTFNDTVTTGGTSHKQGDRTEDKTGNNQNYNLFSDTPQGALTNVDNEHYLTDARKILDTIDENLDIDYSEDITSSGTEAHTGTIRDVATNTKSNAHTGTIGNAGTEQETDAHTGTITDEKVEHSTDAHTGTISDEREEHNTDAHTGTIRNDGTDENERATSENYTDANVYGHNLSSTDEYIETVIGKSSGASYSKLLQEYRETMLNIDMLIIDELSDLFMNIW